jgi:selenophosphate synthetase-related protein
MSNYCLFEWNTSCDKKPYLISKSFSDIFTQNLVICRLLKDYLAQLVSRLNFTAEVGISKDGKWGSLNDDGMTWNGMVGMLVNEETDIVTAGLTRNAVN